MCRRAALKKGSQYVTIASCLWSLVDAERGRRVGNWLADEWAPDDDDDEIHVYGVPSCRYLFNLLEDLSSALEERFDTDSSLRITAAQAEEIRAKYPFLVADWAEEAGHVYSLGIAFSDVEHVILLLKTALKHNRPLCVD